MATVPVHNLSGEQSGEVTLSAEVFEQSPNAALIHQVMLAELANRRRGTACTKTRGEVRGGGRKPWRQKGTGRARVGSRRSPIWTGGGIVHGPRPRSYQQATPRKMREQALRIALSARCEAGEITVVQDLRLQDAKTRELVRLLAPLELPKRALLVLAESDASVELAARNLAGISVALPEELSAYQVLHCHRVVLTQSALARVEEML